MMKILKWVLGSIVFIFLLLFIIGYLSGPQTPKKNSDQEQMSQSSTPTFSEEDIKNQDDLLYAKIDSMLQTKNLSVCEVYRWAGQSEQKIRRDMEAKYGMPDAMKMVDQRNKAYDKDWEKYRAKHSIPDSLRGLVYLLGVYRCD